VKGLSLFTKLDEVGKKRQACFSVSKPELAFSFPDEKFVPSFFREIL
jgi:hypothetical protein